MAELTGAFVDRVGMVIAVSKPDLIESRIAPLADATGFPEIHRSTGHGLSRACWYGILTEDRAERICIYLQCVIQNIARSVAVQIEVGMIGEIAYGVCIRGAFEGYFESVILKSVAYRDRHGSWKALIAVWGIHPQGDMPVIVRISRPKSVLVTVRTAVVVILTVVRC